MPALRAFLVGTAKNEGPFLLEWVAHHLEVGFTDIVLYQNDSDDLTHEMASILRDLGVIQYYINRAPRGGHQVLVLCQRQRGAGRAGDGAAAAVAACIQGRGLRVGQRGGRVCAVAGAGAAFRRVALLRHGSCQRRRFR